MLPILIESALRSLALGAVAWLALKLFRVRNPHVEQFLWPTPMWGDIRVTFKLDD